MRKILRLSAITVIACVPLVACSDDDRVFGAFGGSAGDAGSGGNSGSGTGGIGGNAMSGAGGSPTGGSSGSAGTAGAGNECTLTECGTDCVDTDTTPAHCGACDRACSNTNGSAAACTTGVCAATCNTGFADCSTDDGTGADDGCETDLNQNATCGTTCGNVIACGVGDFCVAGVCTATCSTTECGAACVTLATSNNHCNACDRACSVTNVETRACAAGACEPTCNAGFGDCSVDDGTGADDGCETDLDVGEANCGACDRACDESNTTDVSCTAGLCIPECSNGFADCNVDDGTSDDGCEVDLSSTVTCGTSCADIEPCGLDETCEAGVCTPICSETTCGGECVDTDITATDCGTCDRACNNTNTSALSCAAGACAPTCAVGFGDCDTDDGNGADNGCETNLNSTASCGTTCGTRVICSGGDTCENGVCTAVCSQTSCGTECVNTDITITDCGACERACNNNNATGVACTDGACAPICSAGFGDCSVDSGSADGGGTGDGGGADDGCETDFNSDASCGTDCSDVQTCDVDESCVSGVCTPDCAFAVCGGSCTDTDTTEEHCGACDRACLDDANVTSTTCGAGVCSAVCAAGRADCTQPAAPGADDGCETVLDTDAACGTNCGNVVACGATQGCISGVCVNDNLITNSTFEAGFAPWAASFGGTMSATTEEAHSGLQSGKVSARTGTYQGAFFNLTGIVTQGATYSVSVFGRIAGAPTDTLTLTAHSVCGGVDGFAPIRSLTGSSTAWTELANTFTVPTVGACAAMTRFEIYLEGPAAGRDIYIDDVVLNAQ